MNFIPSLLFFIINLSLLTGCSHYHWGSPRICLPFHTLYIAPVNNESFAPQAQALLSDYLVAFFQQAGVKVVNCEEQAEATLSINLINFERSMATTKNKDTFVARSFNVNLTAFCSLINNCSETPFFCNIPVESSINALTDEGLQAIEYQDMPVITRQLAYSIKELVINHW